ncbi:MAG: PDZ domain-containing protein [Planctomycetales bacterium]|nr:PDZ domain-containing protein [Planctomycetales bacterium]
MNSFPLAGRYVLLSFLIAPVAIISHACAQDAVDLFEQEEAAMRAAVDLVAPSVVRIETFASVERLSQVAGTGPTTGLIVSDKGYVLSSAFNFAAKPESILVTLHTGERIPASIHARDKNRQLVLLKLELPEGDKAQLPVPAILPKNEVRAGQWAIAVGRTLDRDHPNMSVGIISATDRIWGKAVQTDAKISPNNYGGPLIDLDGRVMGILVPLSPQGGSEFAGVEWYDSGIGFATPLDDVMQRLDSLIEGNDLKPGLMGINLKGNDLFGSAAEIAVCRQRTPAYNAGIRKGDTIVRLDDHPIARQSQLKHALGPLYAGDEINIVVKRGDDELPFQVTLTDEIAPFAHPFVGILPQRDVEACVIRYVYPDSPAEKSGLQPGDTIKRIDDVEVQSADQLRELVTALEEKQAVKLTIDRDGSESTIDLTLSELPSDIPTELPPAFEVERDAPQTETGIVEIKLPEEGGTCFALVPNNYDPRVPHSLLVDIPEPDKFDKEKFTESWSEQAKTHGLIVLAPQPTDNRAWLPTEVDFIRKTIEAAKDRYTIDENRVVLSGSKTGASMALLTCGRHRDIVRGLAVVDNAMRLAGNYLSDPTNRLAVYVALSEESKGRQDAEESIKLLQEQRHPVTKIDLGKESRVLNDAERSDLCRWIDSLDRI